MLRLLPVVLVLFAAGCDGEPSAVAVFNTDPPAPPAPAATTFDPAKCGGVTGRVTWAGPPPNTPPFVYGVPAGTGQFTVQMIPNPNRPEIDPESQAVAGAVVFLRGVEPAAAKPWPHAPVRVEMRDRNIHVRQGESEPRRVGFVRRGDSVSVVSAEPLFHVLRGRGASFFSLVFPDPQQPLTRTLDSPGRVELSSGAGFYWASANLFVADHPYYALTDRDGRFALDQVPAGTVEMVAWLPGWDVTRQERDPETGLVTRQTYARPAEVVQRVIVRAGAPVAATLTFP